MAAETCDVVILGLGGMGSAAAMHCIDREVSVIGIEQFGPAHALGSSHGDVRVIRKGYFEHPDYVPLLHRAYDLWHALEARTQRRLLTYTGALLSGSPGADYMQGLEACYRENALPHERLNADEMHRRFPRLSVPEDHSGFYDPLGAYLLVEECVRAHLDSAESAGATLAFHETALSWKATPAGVRVVTNKREIDAKKLIITAGPWAERVMQDLNLPLTVLRKVQTWWECPTPEEYRGPEFPIYLIDRPYGIVYGFPHYGGPGLKMAEHTGGTPVEHPAKVDRAIHDTDEAPLRQFIADCLPGVAPKRAHYSVCMYTCTPDLHFVIDRHPLHHDVVFACGFSGHGFKFASVIGEILAQLALDDATPAPIDFLRLKRFG